MADEIQAGAEMEPQEPLFPLAMTVAIPTARRVSIIAFSGSLSQLELYTPPPRLKLDEAIVKEPRRSYTRWRPFIMSDVQAKTHGDPPVLQ